MKKVELCKHFKIDKRRRQQLMRRESQVNVYFELSVVENAI
jgi:hypothetical protein